MTEDVELQTDLGHVDGIPLRSQTGSLRLEISYFHRIFPVETLDRH